MLRSRNVEGRLGRRTAAALSFFTKSTSPGAIPLSKSRSATKPTWRGSKSITMPTKATSLPYQNIGFTLLPRANHPSWLFIVVAAVVLYLVLPPLFFIIVSSIMPAAEEAPRIPTLANFTTIFESFSDFKLLLWNSLVFSIGSSAWALVFGTALAWLAERTNARFRGVAYVSAFVSFALPGIIKVIGWVLLFGPEAGYLNVAFKSLTGVFPFFNVFSMAGMILVEGFLWTPVVFLLVMLLSASYPYVIDDTDAVPASRTSEFIRP